MSAPVSYDQVEFNAFTDIAKDLDVESVVETQRPHLTSPIPVEGIENVEIIEDYFFHDKFSAKLALHLKIITPNAPSTDGGWVEIALPLIDLQAKKEQLPEKTTQIATFFYRFLCALDPEKWHIYASRDSQYRPLDKDGKEMSQAEQKARAALVTQGVYGLAARIADGQVTFAGGQLNIYRTANPKDPENKYPYNNWRVLEPVEETKRKNALYEKRKAEKEYKKGQRSESIPF